MDSRMLNKINDLKRLKDQHTKIYEDRKLLEIEIMDDCLEILAAANINLNCFINHAAKGEV